MTYDNYGFENPFPAHECQNYDQGDCSGPVHTRYSRSGLTSTLRCDAHEYAHQEVLDGINRRYPDSPVAPDWFDPTYAGERWDDDY